MTVRPHDPDLKPGISFPQEIEMVIAGLQSARREWRAAHPRKPGQGGHLPSRQALERISRELCVALFPLRLGPPELNAGNENAYVAATLESTLAQLAAQIGFELGHDAPTSDSAGTAAEAARIVGVFAAQLPDVRRALDADVEAGYANDPAARSVDEVLIAYPSFHALIHYRMANLLHRLGTPLVARLIAAIAQARTGIDIHPPHPETILPPSDSRGATGGPVSNAGPLFSAPARHPTQDRA